MLILAVRPAMDPEQQRILLPRDVPDRLDEKTVRLVAVLRLEADVLGRGELHFLEPRIVLVRQLTERAVFQREDFGRGVRRAVEDRDLPVGCHRVAAEDAAAVDQLLYRAAGDGNASEIPGTVVSVSEDDRLSVRGELWVAHRAIERLRQNARRTAHRRNDGEAVLVVRAVFGVAAAQVGDRGSVRAPGERAAVGTVERRELLRRRAAARFDYEYVRVVRPIEIARHALALERDPLSVGRPGRLVFVEQSRHKVRRLTSLETEQVDVRVRRIEIAAGVALE